MMNKKQPNAQDKTSEQLKQKKERATIPAHKERFNKLLDDAVPPASKKK
jgi:hypothetical protein